MRARDRELPPGAGADYGVAHGIVGIADGRGVERFGQLTNGTFVWTRASDGDYRLGRIVGPLRHDPEAERTVGLPHIRATTWLSRTFAEDEVPAGVAATFARGGGNLQQTHDAEAERETVDLWKRLSSDRRPPRAPRR
jgi:hypothetical protein